MAKVKDFYFRDDTREIVIDAKSMKEAIVIGSKYPGVTFKDDKGRAFRHNQNGKGGFWRDIAGKVKYWRGVYV